MCLCRVTRILKTDMFAPEGEGRAGEIYLGDGMIGGEPQFVARDAKAMAAKKCAYDDGYLVLYATHIETMTSYFMVRLKDSASLLSAVCLQVHHIVHYCTLLITFVR